MQYAFPMVDTRILLQSIQTPIDPETLVSDDETDRYFFFVVHVGGWTTILCLLFGVCSRG